MKAVSHASPPGIAKAPFVNERLQTIMEVNVITYVADKIFKPPADHKLQRHFVQRLPQQLHLHKNATR